MVHMLLPSYWCDLFQDNRLDLTDIYPFPLRFLSILKQRLWRSSSSTVPCGSHLVGIKYIWIDEYILVLNAIDTRRIAYMVSFGLHSIHCVFKCSSEGARRYFLGDRPDLTASTSLLKRFATKVGGWTWKQSVQRSCSSSSVGGVGWNAKPLSPYIDDER